MSSRYDLPDPKCRHARLSVRVTSGSFDGSHASVLVCDRAACIEDAKAWAFASTQIQPTVTVRDLMADLEKSLEAGEQVTDE